MSNHPLKSVPRLPLPSVPQAVGKVLTLRKQDGAPGITVKVARWRNIAFGQLTTLHVCGHASDGSIIMLRIVDGEPLTEEEAEAGWCRIINWEQLQELEHGSDITFVFQAVLEDAECACAELFPPLNLEIRWEYEDRTTFSAQDGKNDWNGWKRGAAGADPRDLVVQPDGNKYALYNNTFTHQSAGIVLWKNFLDLEVGRSYTFGVSVHRYVFFHETPRLSLNSGAQVIAPETPITSQAWLEGTFTASSSQEVLEIVSHVASGKGNDYIITEIVVKSS